MYLEFPTSGEALSDVNFESILKMKIILPLQILHFPIAIMLSSCTTLTDRSFRPSTVELTNITPISALASDDISKPYDIVLTPQSPTNEKAGVTLKSVSPSGLVTIKDRRGIKYKAWTRGPFVNKWGGHDHLLQSVDLKTKRVVLQGYAGFIDIFK